MTARQVAKAKYRLPADVTRMNPDDMNRHHVIVMLDFMGTPTRNLPENKATWTELLRQKIAENPVKAQAGYDVIVMGKLPEGAATTEKEVVALKAHFYGAMAEVLNSDQNQALKDKLREAVDGVRKTLENDAKRALSEAAQNYRPVVVKQGAKETKVGGVLPTEFERIVQLASQRIPVMMVGPAGCGKSFIAKKVAEALDLPFGAQSCSEGVSESVFFGRQLPIGKAGAFEFVSTPFIECYEKGGVFCFDEMDAADPNLLTSLNMALANDGFYVPARHTKPFVKRHPNFTAIAAANTFGKGADAQYVGRNALDAATLDRYRAGMIQMDYSAEVETALIDGGVLAWGRAIRDKIYANKLRKIMSTRVMLDFTKMTRACEWKQADWEKAYFADWTREELRLIGRNA